MTFLSALLTTYLLFLLDAIDVGPLKELEWGQINFIHTTDVHGWFEGHMKERNSRADWGDFYSFAQHMREKAKTLDVDLILVDTGDLHDGAGLSDATHPDGKESDKLFMMTDFDLLTVGNHDLADAGRPEASHTILANHYGDKYITSNVNTSQNGLNSKPIGSRSYYHTTPKGIRIMAFGIMYDYWSPPKNVNVQLAEAMIQETWFQAAVKRTDVDLFVLVGHNPARLNTSDNDNNSTMKFIAEEIQKKTPGIPVQAFAGHSHVRDFMVYNDNATALQSGKYADTVGWLAMSGIHSPTYNGSMYPANVPNPTRHAVTSPKSNLTYARRYLDWNRETFQYHTGTAGDDKAFDTTNGTAISRNITLLRNEYNLTDYYGCAPRSYCISCKPYGSEGNIYTLFEDALAKVVVSKERENIPRLIFSNKNSIRYDIAQGPFTYDDSFILCPWADYMNFTTGVTAEDASKLYDTVTYYTEHNKCPPTADVSFGDMLLENSGTGSKQKVLSRRSVSRRSVQSPGMLTAGYRTGDDFGNDGDDTQHAPVPYYQPPAYAKANVTVPGQTYETLYDIVFIDHIAKYIMPALNCINKGKYHMNKSYYVDQSINTNTLIGLYAQTDVQWNRTMQNCSVGAFIG
ncbi:Metallo-dependent phosphatase-like protein [Talaromyces proteolyticus]|uniref:Metallo-dependent phosphatase-like protein n=1 Tax=Talaromyces proteolyticus TaxID=1131652 RepID=A0AAD4PRQ5_9EURO|nr:Metallo-dependent phosphatase-like protein [Talaromyces proteolyticus]KAH8689459.1 Metallo-dependent phosphatase-like protein [Talaromyces proteolyticus]